MATCKQLLDFNLVYLVAEYNRSARHGHGLAYGTSAPLPVPVLSWNGRPTSWHELGLCLKVEFVNEDKEKANNG